MNLKVELLKLDEVTVTQASERMYKGWRCLCYNDYVNMDNDDIYSLRKLCLTPEGIESLSPEEYVREELKEIKDKGLKNIIIMDDDDEPDKYFYLMEGTEEEIIGKIIQRVGDNEGKGGAEVIEDVCQAFETSWPIKKIDPVKAFELGKCFAYTSGEMIEENGGFEIVFD
jgi:hypothetical protein